MTKVPISETTYRIGALADTEVHLLNDANEVAVILGRGPLRSQAQR